MSDRVDRDAVDAGCAEHRLLTRRQFLRRGAETSAAAAALQALPAWLPGLASARTDATERDFIVLIFLRGGADGLSLCAPCGDPLYYAARPTIAIPPPDSRSPLRGLALGDGFAFPQAMAPLLPAYRAEELLVVHATGQVGDSRSHFEAQRCMEIGAGEDANLVTGWLGRHLASVPPARSDSALRAISVSSGLAKTLAGAPRTLPMVDPAVAGIGGNVDTLVERMRFIKEVYASEPGFVGKAAVDSLAASVLLSSLDLKGYTPAGGAVYPSDAFGRSLRSVAALVKADVGIEAAQVDLGGWDTHVSQDPLAGSMFRTMTVFAKALAAFHADVIAPGRHRVTVVAMTEFGRNVAENGSGGTDHGRATAMLVLGRAISGGRVLVNGWPGLEKDNLEAGQDLKVTLDYRDILGEIVSKRLANDNVSSVFPGPKPNFRGVVRSHAAPRAGA